MSGRVKRFVRGLALVVAALALGLGAGAAYAYFVAGGSGTGSGAIDSPAGITVTAATGAADLIPGGTGAVYFTLGNPNSFSSSFSSVTSASVVSSSSGSCPIGNLSVAQTLPYSISPLVVGANSTSGAESISDFVQLASTAPNACQGATFTVSLTLTGNSP